MKKLYVILTAGILYSFPTQAQSFSIKITQVYPRGGVVFGDSYNLWGELKKAESALRTQYSGGKVNYIMELSGPGTKETKAIQNIRWIKIENGQKIDFKNKPGVENSYDEPTTIEIYECNNDGTKKGGGTKTSFDYYYQFTKSGQDTITDRHFRTLDESKRIAGEVFTKHKVDTLSCGIKIFNSQGIVADSSINNAQAYSAYVTRLIQARDSTKQAAIRQTEEVAQAEKAENTAYDRQKTAERLNLLANKTKELKKSEADFRHTINRIVQQADSIVESMRTDRQIDFDRNKYFEGNLNNLKKGIDKLIEINNEGL